MSTAHKPKATIKFTANSRVIHIPVADDVKAYFDSQFSRPNPTHQQKKRYATVMNLLRCAYKAGRDSVGP